MDTLFLFVCSAICKVWYGQTPVEVKPSAWLMGSQQYHAANILVVHLLDALSSLNSLLGSPLGICRYHTA